MILREAFDYEFSPLDPATGAHIDPPSVAIYETLILKGPGNVPYPMLAESWEVGAGGLEWRIRLRRGLHFHSGAPCDADAVLAALQTLRWGGGGEHQVGYWDPVDEVRTDGSNTLVFRLHYPYARLPSLLWGTHTAIHGDATRTRSGDAYGRTVVDGSGPFRCVEWSPTRIVAERWVEYPGSPASLFENHGPARLQAIEWLAIPDERERLEALESGQVHCLHGPVLSEVERLRADPRFIVVEYPQCSNVYLGLNWDRPELGFADLRVRRAVSLAIDRAAIVERALAGHGTPAYSIIGPGDAYYAPEADQGRAYDPGAADALLDAAGWTREASGIRSKDGHRLVFECVGQDDDILRRLAEIVRDQLAPHGIRLELRFAKPFADFYAACGALPRSFISKWLWPDGIDASILFTAGWNYPEPNWQHSRVPELDTAFGDWLRAETEPQLQAAATRAQFAAADQLPYIPLVTPNDVWVMSTKVHGWRPPPENLYPFYQDTWLEE